MIKTYQWVIAVLVLTMLGFIVWISTNDKISATILLLYLLTIVIISRVMKIKKRYGEKLVVGVNLLFVLYLLYKFLT